MTDPLGGAGAIRVDGLAQFSRNLKKIDSGLPKALRVALNEVADVVVTDARPNIPTRSGQARGSVKARSTRTRSRVIGGGKRAPYYPWLDFGGRVGRRLSVRRPFIPEGRYIYRSYYDKLASGAIVDALEKSLLDVARQAGIVID